MIRGALKRGYMISAIHHTLSGIRAAVGLQSVSANNVANANTDGFKGGIARVEEGNGNGVKVTLSQHKDSGTMYDRGDGSRVESSNVDIARESVRQINATHLLRANIAALKTSNDMMGNMIDILA